MSSQRARRRAACWSSSRGGSTPGASSRSRSCPSRTQRRLRVTPARRALSTTFWRTRRLISADLPTLGKPSISARTGRGRMPRARRRALRASPARIAACCSCFTPVPLLASHHHTDCPWLRNQALQASRAWGGTMSRRLSTSRCCLPPIQRCNRGWPVESGMRASRTSITRSTLARASCRAFSALAMWPGYHWMAGALTRSGSIRAPPAPDRAPAESPGRRCSAGRPRGRCRGCPSRSRRH